LKAQKDGEDDSC
jgi:hypothetical protein